MQYATFGQRIHAAVIDLAVIVIANAGLFLMAKERISNALQEATTEDARQMTALMAIAVMMLGSLMIDIVYFVMLPARTRCTFGHYFLKLRMTMGDGTLASMNAIALKHCVSLILLGILLYCIWSTAWLPTTQEQQVFTLHMIIVAFGWALINLFVMGSNAKFRSLSDYIADIAILDKESVKPNYVIYYMEEARKKEEEEAQQEKNKKDLKNKQAEDADSDAKTKENKAKQDTKKADKEDEDGDDQ
jgi:phosphoglycerol transferase MdoB-like AlkP superfamily enzyme